MITIDQVSFITKGEATLRPWNTKLKAQNYSFKAAAQNFSFLASSTEKRYFFLHERLYSYKSLPPD